MQENFSNDGLETDQLNTAKNRRKLMENRNLLLWYENLYSIALNSNPQVLGKDKILEIGSGTSPLKHFYPRVVSSDVLKLDHVDMVFDAHEIDKLQTVPDGTFDIIAMTNVLHHLERPIDVMNSCACKLRSGGSLLIIEPYFSVLSKIIFVLVHHEPTNFRIDQPINVLKSSPLLTANICLPYLIFFKRNDWLQRLAAKYKIEEIKLQYYTSLAYPLTGGISKTFPIPSFLFQRILKFDIWLARTFPRFFAFQFIVQITKR
jgi:SAM-dependent methyltransferase